MKKIKYGAMVNGGYVRGVVDGVLRTSDNFDELLYADNESTVLDFIKRTKEKFSDSKFELVTLTIETEIID